MTCKDCFFWQKGIDSPQMGRCNCGRLSGSIANEATLDGLRPLQEPNQLRVYWIETGPDFGCVHWKQDTDVKGFGEDDHPFAEHLG